MDNVHVAIRLRPFIKRESENDAHHHWKAEGKNVQQYDVKGKPIGKPYTFDRVFDENETTADVYEEIAQPIISSAMDGYDGTIFAYGQTSSGKTFTMQGSRLSPGIIPSTVNEVFETIENTPDREFLLRVSYAELYNEGITDLLSDEKKQLSIRENGERVYVSNLTEEVCTSSGQILSLMRKGDARRHVGRTNMNEHSSRSHTIFCMIIESRGRMQQGEGAVKVAHLNLVDLAGSERANETKAEGTRFKEACNINQSLFVLGTVINRLASGAEFVPFRDSKLTRILSSSLGGNAKTAIICTITAASLEQTQSTLQFATRAKTIKNKPVMNEILSDEALMQRMKKEIQSLKKKLEESNAQAPSALTDGEKEALLSQERERMKKEVMKEMQEKMDYFNNMVVVSKGGATPKKQLKRKPRRETWCPGMQLQPLLLPRPEMLRSHKSPLSEASSASPASFPDTSDVDPRTSISSESLSSISSTEFNEENADAFRTEVLNVDSETFLDANIPDLDVTYSRKTKRRRANVHFGEDSVYSFTPEEFNRETACQTESVASVSEDHVLEVTATLHSAQEEIEILKQKLEERGTNDASAALESKAREAELQAALDTAHKENKELKDILAVEQREELTELQAALDAAILEKEELKSHLANVQNKELTELQLSLDNANRENEELKARLVEVQSGELIEMQAALAAANGENEELKTRLAEVPEGKLMEMQAVLDSANRENVELMARLAEVQNGELTELQAALDSASAENADLKARLGSMEANALTDAMTALEKSHKELCTVQSALDSANQERKTLEETHASENTRLQAELESTVQELQALKEQYDRRNTIELADALVTLDKQAADLSKLQAAMQISREEKETLERRLQEMPSSELDNIKATLECSQKENAELRSRIEEEQTEQVREMQAAVEALKEENAALKGRLEEQQTKDVGQVQAEESEEILVMKAELEMSAALCDALQEEKDQLQAKLEEKDQLQVKPIDNQPDAATAAQMHHPDVDKLKGELMESLTLCETLNEEKNQLQSMLAETKKELAVRTDQSSDIAKLKEEIAGLRFELMQKSEEYAELQQFTRWEDKTLKDQEAEYLCEINRLQEMLKQKDKDLNEIETKISTQLTQSENEKKDLDFLLDAEKERHRSLNSELRQQLQEAYDRLKEKEGAGDITAEECMETEHREKVANLESRLAEAMQEMESLKEKESRKEDMVKELEAKLVEKMVLEEEKVPDLESRLAELSKETESMKEKESRSQEIVMEVEAKLASALQEKKTMEEEKVPELESRLADILLEMETQKKKEMEQVEKVADLEARLVNLAEEKETLREAETLKEQKIMELESRMAIVPQEQEDGVKQEKLMEMESKLASMLQETKALKEERNLKEEKIRELESVLSSVPEEDMDVDVKGGIVTELEARLATVLQEIESMKEEAAQKNEKIAELESRLGETEQEMEREEKGKLTDLEARLETVLKEMEALRDEKDVKEEQIRMLDSRLASVQQDKGGVEEDRVIELEARLTNVLQEVEDLKEEKTVREEKIAQMESWLSTGMQEIESLREEKDLRETQMSELEERLRILSKDNGEESKVVELEAHLTKVLQDMDTLREESNLKEDKVLELESQLASIVQEMETLKEEKSLKDEQVMELETKLAMISQEKEHEDEGKVAELESHLTGVLQELEALKEDKNLKEDKGLQVESHLDTVLQEMDALKREKNLKEEQVSKLELRLASVSQEQDMLIEEKVEKVNEVEEKLASVLQEMEALKGEKIVNEEQITELETRLANVSQEQDTLREEKLNELESRLSSVLQEICTLKEEARLKEEKATLVETRLAETVDDIERLQEKLARINEEKSKLEAANFEIMSQMQKDVVTMETQTEEDEGEKEPNQDLHEALEKFHQVLAAKEQEISEVKAQSSHEIQRLEELQRCLEDESREHEEKITSELRNLENDKTSLEAALTKAELELADSVFKTRLLKEEMEMMESKLEIAESKLTEMASVQQEQQMEELMLELDSARNLLAQKEDEVEKFQEFMKMENEEAVKREAQSHNEIKRLHNLLQQLEEESKDAKVQISKDCESRWQGICEELRTAMQEAQRENQRLETALRDAQEKQELMEKEVKKRKEEVKRVRIETMKDVLDWEERANTICGEIQEELDAEKAKVKESEEKLSKYEAQCEELKEEIKARDEEIDKVKEDRRDIFNKKEMLTKQNEKMKKQLNQTVLNSIREVGEAEARANTVCEELEEELEAEKTKVKEAQEKVESQAKHICELEAKLHSHLMQSKGGDTTTTRALESELSAKKRELTVLEMEHTREILKLEDRIRDLESEKKFLDEKNREYRNELRREHQRAADNSANYPEAGICGSGASYDVSVFSLRSEKEAMGRNLRLTQKKYETLKTQRDEQVARNSKLKQEVFYWKGKYDKLKSFAEQKVKESRATQPLADCNTEHPGIPSSALESGAASPTLRGEMRAGTSPYKGTLQDRMFEIFKKPSKPEPDNPEECTTQ